jgi:hypothetical protein
MSDCINCRNYKSNDTSEGIHWFNCKNHSHILGSRECVHYDDDKKGIFPETGCDVPMPTCKPPKVQFRLYLLERTGMVRHDEASAMVVSAENRRAAKSISYGHWGDWELDKKKVKVTCIGKRNDEEVSPKVILVSFNVG